MCVCLCVKMDEISFAILGTMQIVKIRIRLEQDDIDRLLGYYINDRVGDSVCSNSEKIENK